MNGDRRSRSPLEPSTADSIIELTTELVRIPSRSGVDSYEPVIGRLERWLSDHGLRPRRLTGESGEQLALTCDVRTDVPGPRYVLDACIDTVPFGDEAAWTYPPTSACIVDGWLYGRGSADCKVAAAIFSHIAAEVRAEAGRLRGTLTLLFDADEHTGGFGGVKALFAHDAGSAGVAGVMIGYPGDDEVIVGGRGFVRARLSVHGTAGHTGGRRSEGNAVAKAAVLVTALESAPLPGASEESVRLPSKLTVTAIRGGEGFSMIPDLCTVSVDVRLAPGFQPEAAMRVLTAVVREVDDRIPSHRPTGIAFEESWPAYVLPASSALVRSLTAAAARIGGRRIPTRVAGPSNIGNYLASLGVEATAGYGVRYRNVHGTDECIDVGTIATVHAVYGAAVRSLLRR